MRTKSIPFVLLTFAALSIAVLVLGQSSSAGPPFGLEPPAPPKYAMEVTGAKHVVGVWQTRVYTTNFPASEWMISFPAAMDLSRQSGAKTTLTPDGETLKESSPAQRPFVSLHVRQVNGVTPQSIPLSVRYEATMLARKLVSGPRAAAMAPAPPLDAREKAIYTSTSPTLDFRSETFQTWLEIHRLRKQANEDEVDFARRVFSTMLGTYRYRDGVPINPASKICNLTDLDCDTMSIVFVSAMRANQCPARVLFAWPARTLRPDPKGIISGHAQAEFFAPGAGWVPIDVARAQIARKDPARHFGEDDGMHLVAQLDPDYLLKSPIGMIRTDSMHPGPDVWTRGAPKRADVRFQPQSWEVSVTELQIRR